MLTEIKLRCSGQRTGCDRCEAASSRCIYSPSAHSRDVRRASKRIESPRLRHIKKRQRIDRTETHSHQPKPLRHNSKGNTYESVLCLHHEQDDGQPQDPHKPEPRSATLRTDLAKASPEARVLEFPPTSPPDFIGDIKSLYEPPTLVADECYSYSIGIRDFWASVPTAEAYYHANPIDLTYNEIHRYNDPVVDHANSASTLFTVGTSVQLKERGIPQYTQAQNNAIFWP